MEPIKPTKMHIQISKSKKTLKIIDNNQEIFKCKCFTGKNSGRKLKKDDMKIPEGEYCIVVKNPESKFYLSLGLNYPNISDAKQAYKQKIINKETRDLIIKRQEQYLQNSKTIIPWDTEMEGKIYIHGEGDNNKNWTEGCIKLNNKDIKKVFDLSKIGISVKII
jgi:murein L,D-transpeptidase YafK